MPIKGLLRLGEARNPGPQADPFGEEDDMDAFRQMDEWLEHDDRAGFSIEQADGPPDDAVVEPPTVEESPLLPAGYVLRAFAEKGGMLGTNTSRV